MKKLIITFAIILLSAVSCNTFPQAKTEIKTPKSSISNQTANQTKRTSSKPCPPPQIDSSNLKTYRDVSAGFEIKYPGSYIITQNNDRINILLTDPANEALDYFYSAGIIKNPSRLTLTQYVENLRKKNDEPESSSVSSPTSIILDGVKGVEATISSPNAFIEKSIYLPAKNGNIINLEYSLRGCDPTFSGEFFIKSFKFIR